MMSYLKKRCRIFIAGIAGLVSVVALALVLGLGGSDVEASAPMLAGENKSGDVSLSWNVDAESAWCRRIDGNRGERPYTWYKADVSGKETHVFEVERAGSYVCGLSGGDRVRSVQVSTCDPDLYDRSDWGSYPAVPEDAKPRWATPEDDLADMKLEHDHHVALKVAHSGGACGWTKEQKDAFSSDSLNLNPTAGSFNASKGSRTPDELTGIAKSVIDTKEEKCEYGRQHSRVMRKYGLSMTPVQKETVESWMRMC